LVHPTPLARDADQFALHLLRDQIGQKVYPIHRLDRKTSGVLLFAKTPSAHVSVQQLFQTRQINKTYLALVRGFILEASTIDYPLTTNEKVQSAQTQYQPVEWFEIPIASGKFPTSRYTLVELTPLTGRYHQLRKHMAHIFHPIIGDRPHGCNKQNRLWKQQFDMTTMLLHARSLHFYYPDEQPLTITASLSEEFKRVLQLLRKMDINS